MISLFLLLLQLLSTLRRADGVSISMPNCADHCGGVQIPYPFGVGANCYQNKSFEIVCNASFSPSKPFLQQFNFEVLDISWPRFDTVRNIFVDTETIIVSIPPRNLCGNDGSTPLVSSLDFRDSPYQISRLSNVLMVKGCGGRVVLRDKSGEDLAGCASICPADTANMNQMTCHGVGCCLASLLSVDDYFGNEEQNKDDGLDFCEITVDSEQLQKSNTCNASATLIESGSVESFAGTLSSLKTFPVKLDWQAPNVSPVHNENVTCQDFSCFCKHPYEGNPYLPYGCQVVEACRKCKDRCDFEGADYNVTGAKYYYCRKHLLLRKGSIFGFSVGMGVMLMVLASYWLYRFVQHRKDIRQKATNFKRNGGLLLQQQMSSKEGVAETTRIFAVTELEKATDNFNENRILGQGGQGAVYKGMLMDGKIVAIKKSNKVDESQVEAFINEVIILSQINHRNVVKLLGCCLETEVPILVYEFIQNGTLYQHIQGLSEDFHIDWRMRLQIAADSAGAVAYLHSSSSAPIYHRDIKSTNILLDEKFRAKISDFGTSRAITIEQTHVTTAVRGTYGYLDPEYFQSHQFTEKSDVYSFGVVLVELITGKKPICPLGNGGWISLATEFLSQMEDPRVFDMLDPRIIDEGKQKEFMAVAELARRCLNMNGKLRPTMKEIAVLLDEIRSSYIPASEGLKQTVEVNDLGNEVVNKCNGSFSRFVSFLDDDPPACSIEIQLSSTKS